MVDEKIFNNRVVTPTSVAFLESVFFEHKPKGLIISKELDDNETSFSQLSDIDIEALKYCDDVSFDDKRPDHLDYFLNAETAHTAVSQNYYSDLKEGVSSDEDFAPVATKKTMPKKMSKKKKHQDATLQGTTSKAAGSVWIRNFVNLLNNSSPSCQGAARYIILAAETQRRHHPGSEWGVAINQNLVNEFGHGILFKSTHLKSVRHQLTEFGFSHVETIGRDFVYMVPGLRKDMPLHEFNRVVGAALLAKINSPGVRIPRLVESKNMITGSLKKVKDGEKPTAIGASMLQAPDYEAKKRFSTCSGMGSGRVVVRQEGTKKETTFADGSKAKKAVKQLTKTAAACTSALPATSPTVASGNKKRQAPDGTASATKKRGRPPKFVSGLDLLCTTAVPHRCSPPSKRRAREVACF